jgi:CheY-like chemotaxis protein
MIPLVIIVDDDPDDIEFFSMGLKDGNFECSFRSFTNGNDFIEFVNQQKDKKLPMAVAIDINMPVISGIELLNKLNEYHLLEIIPVFIISTASAKSHEKECLKLGAKRYYTKPVCKNDWKNIAGEILHSIRMAS